MSERVELYVDEADEWRWRRIAANGNIVSDSGEGYMRQSDCREMAEKLNPGVGISEAAAEE